MRQDLSIGDVSRPLEMVKNIEKSVYTLMPIWVTRVVQASLVARVIVTRKAWKTDENVRPGVFSFRFSSRIRRQLIVGIKREVLWYNARKRDAVPRGIVSFETMTNYCCGSKISCYAWCNLFDLFLSFSR